MAEHGFFVQELNAGWAEWSDASLPTHRGRVARGEIRCTCSDAVETGYELRR